VVRSGHRPSIRHRDAQNQAQHKSPRRARPIILFTLPCKLRAGSIIARVPSRAQAGQNAFPCSAPNGTGERFPLLFFDTGITRLIIELELCRTWCVFLVAHAVAQLPAAAIPATLLAADPDRAGAKPVIVAGGLQKNTFLVWVNATKESNYLFMRPAVCREPGPIPQETLPSFPPARARRNRARRLLLVSGPGQIEFHGNFRVPRTVRFSTICSAGGATFQVRAIGFPGTRGCSGFCSSSSSLGVA